MEKNNQTQKAGNNSIQVQIDKVENNFGNSLEEIQKIVNNEITIALKDNALVAESIARNRLNEFSNIFLPKLVKANLIECFSDPAIQIFFRGVEKTAICTDDKDCYKILSEILIHRANKKNDFVIVAAANKAVEIADKISDDALLFLTIFLCIDSFIPNSGNIEDGLSVLDSLYKNILSNKEIPFSQKIIDNLEITDAIRVNSFLSHKKFDEIFQLILEGYCAPGIEINSESYKNAKKLILEIGIEFDSIFSKSLIENYVRINVVNESFLEKLLISNQQEKVNKILKEIYNSL